MSLSITYTIREGGRTDLTIRGGRGDLGCRELNPFDILLAKLQSEGETGVRVFDRVG